MKVDFKNREQLLVIVAIGAIALLAGDRLLLTPLAASWHGRSDEITKMKRSFAQGTQLLQRDKTIQARWDQMHSRMLSNDVSAAEGQVCSAFYRWAQDRRVGITSVKPLLKRPTDEYTTLECRVEASGNLAALAQFLYDVERGQMALRVEDVELGARDDTGQLLSLNLQVSGLVLNPKQAP